WLTGLEFDGRSFVVGSRQEKIHRWAGFKSGPELRAELEEALRRFELYRRGDVWDAPASRPARICEEGEVVTVPVPSKGMPNGITLLGEDLWIVQGSTLFRLDPASGEARGSFPLEGGITDLCTDGKVLYAVPYGWTSGEPIREIDPATGKVTRTIATPENEPGSGKAAMGIAWREGRLWVLHGPSGRILGIDAETGKQVAEIDAGARWLTGLEFDGRSFVVGSDVFLLFVDPEAGGTVGKVAVKLGVRSVGFGAGSYWILERPLYDYDREHRLVQVGPDDAPIHRLTLGRLALPRRP
ncbi:MAG TPA: hypothetical protein VKF62_14940, partial [Planctomycetota bacterium]|nr:hypothetical protein [Planctomycetota bacterium]